MIFGKVYRYRYLICHRNILELITSLRIFIRVELHGKLPEKGKIRQRLGFQGQLALQPVSPEYGCILPNDTR